MTRTAQPIDAQRLPLILNDLRLPAIKQTWPDIAARADKEGWPAARFLAATRGPLEHGGQHWALTHMWNGPVGKGIAA